MKTIEIETIALSYLDFCGGQPIRSEFIKWCNLNGVVVTEELWNNVVLQSNIL